ncbi:hypothetical protein, partial [Mesorhizobium sp.]|uniref:hypothetical protein n=1 Tax=Mesorhizobium sp. TaxID=1871066 RepID=UPI00257D3C57
APGSPVARGERIPRWARPSLVLRDGRSMRFQDMGRLAAGDHVYIFVPDRYPALLDKLFASRAAGCYAIGQKLVVGGARQFEFDLVQRA